MTELPKMRKGGGIAHRITNPREDFILLTLEELAAVNQLAKEKYPNQPHPFDNLTKAEIQRLVEEAKQSGKVIPLPVDEEEQKAREERAQAIARDLDRVPAGGEVLIFAGEGSVSVYGDPEVHRAFQEAHKRQVKIKVCIGPVLSVEKKEDGSVESKGLLYFAEQGWIESWQRPTRETTDHFRVFTLNGEEDGAVESAHEPGCRLKERSLKRWDNEQEKRTEIEQKKSQFERYIKGGVQMLEERVAKIEGIVTQMDKRLDQMDKRLDQLTTEIAGLRGEMAGLRGEMWSNFKWTIGSLLGILIPMWVSIILAIIIKG
ncbi:MAG: hypothetical protein QXI19_12915 [Candidatus Caldarchaeum sp.]